MLGTQLSTLTRCRCIACAQAAGSRRATSSSATTAPPALNRPKMSYTERSNSSADTASARSAGPMANRSLRSSMVFIAARCGTSTPLGTPVDPDVNSTYATDSGSRTIGAAAGGCACASAIASVGKPVRSNCRASAPIPATASAVTRIRSRRAGGLIESDRDVHRARGQHAERGRYLVGSLGKLDRDCIAGPTPTASSAPATLSASRASSP